MKIDIYSHILPKKYLDTCIKKASAIGEVRELRLKPVTDLNVRLRLMDRYPDVLQVLTLASPPIEQYTTPEIAAELAKIANDELAELVEKYPDKFVAAAACVPMNNVDAALEEIDRAIRQLGLKGIQIYTKINNETLDNQKFKPIFEQMAKFDLPIWIHPCTTKEDSDLDGLFRWPYESSCSMEKLVSSGLFREYPDIKIIIHHCGAMIPFFSQRIKWLYPLDFDIGEMRNPVDIFKKFYGDTATYGSSSAVMCGYDFFGADHLLFGTDAPMPPNGLTQETIRSIELTSINDDDKQKIFEQNAIDLLKLAI